MVPEPRQHAKAGRQATSFHFTTADYMRLLFEQRPLEFKIATVANYCVCIPAFAFGTRPSFVSALILL